MNLPFFIARRYLSHQKGVFSSITRLAIVATSLSVAIMLLSLAIVTGFEGAIREKIFSFTGHLHVSSFDLSKSTALNAKPIFYDKALAQKMRQLNHVRQVAPFVERPVILQFRGTLEGVKLKGVNPDYTFSPGMTITGKPIDYSDTGYSRQIMLSQTTAAKLDIKAGDTLQIQFFSGGTIPRIRKVTVAGFYHSGLTDVDKFYALCDIRLLQHISNWTGDSINAYQLDLDNEYAADSIANYIHFNLINAPLEAYTTVENNQNLFEWLDVQTINGVILLVIMAIVAVINMGAVLLIMMIDRANMIGLLKAMGMSFRETVNIFLAIGAIIGTVGIVGGNVLALGLCWAQLKFGLLTLPEESYFMKYVPVKVVWWHVVATDLGSLLLFVVCMLLPAMYVRKIQPAKVLQFK